jgi:hypothetical protein
MVGKSNLILLVPTGGSSSQYTSDCVLFWDDKVLKNMLTLAFTDTVHSMSFTNNVTVVPQPKLTACISLKSQVVHKIETGRNPKGLHAVSYGEEFCVVVPDLEEGHVLVTWLQHEDFNEADRSS